jgi:uncharacterized membrane protein YqjE
MIERPKPLLARLRGSILWLVADFAPEAAIFLIVIIGVVIVRTVPAAWMLGSLAALILLGALAIAWRIRRNLRDTRDQALRLPRREIREKRIV